MKQTKIWNMVCIKIFTMARKKGTRGKDQKKKENDKKK